MRRTCGRTMNYNKNQREGDAVPQMVPKFWSAPESYYPLRGSPSAIQSNLHSLNNSHFRHESQPLSGGFFSFSDEYDTNFLLEDSQVTIDSTIQCCGLCKCGHKQLEASNPLRFRSFLGYLPEVEEEMSMSFPYSQHGSCISPPDEEFKYGAYSQSILGTRRGTPETDLEFVFSDTSNLSLRSSAGVPYLPTYTDENCQGLEQGPSMNSSPSLCSPQTRQRDGRKMFLYTPGNFQGREQDKFDIYNSSVTFLDPMHVCGNLRHEGIQSPGFGVHFRNNQGIFVPSIIRPKQAMSNSASELPSSSSVSVSSDETEHPQIKVGLYKTELCRSWEETGYCRYAAKCQFAHGNDDLRPVPRHPKYKTELCRSYTETGLCSYGKRCRFIHSSTSLTQGFPLSSDLEKKGSRRLSIFQQLSGAGEMPPRQD